MKLLIQWAVTSGALILIVLAARRLFRDKLSARWRYALWAIVLARLLVPFQVELPARVSESVPLLASNLAPETARWEEPSIPVFPQEDFPLPGFDRADLHQLEPGEIMPTDTSIGYWQRSQDGETVTVYLGLLSPAQIVRTVWGTGAALMALALLVSNLLFALRLERHRKPLEGAEAPIAVYTAEGLPSPCLLGVFQPAVYVTPEAAENPDTLRHVLAHELTHYAHKDHIWSFLRCLALAIHWYNPLVWLAVALSKRDGELACDEGAVARLGEEERVSYGRTLVDMVAARSAQPADLLSCSTAMTGGRKSIQQRVARLVKKPKTVKIALFAAAVVAVAAVFVFAGRKEAGAYDAFLAQVKAAQSIFFGNPVVSSQSPPPAISDPAALAQAKDILSKVIPVVKDDDKWTVMSLSSDSAKRPEPITQEELERQYLIWGHRLNLYPTAEHDLDTADRYFLIPWDDYCLLTRRYPEGEENKQEVVAALPGDTVNRLRALAQGKEYQPETNLTGLDRFRAEVEAASSIRVYPPTYSSTIYPYPLTNEDLLAEAKEALSAFVLLDDGDPQPDFDTKEILHESRITLAFEGGEEQYSLLYQNDHTYLFPGSILRQAIELREAEGETAQLQGVSGTCISKQGDNVISTLMRLAKGQSRLSMDPMPMVRSELEEYSQRLLRGVRLQLQGRPDDSGSVEFHAGYISETSGTVELWYYGDDTHSGVWVLALDAGDYTVLNDRPIVVHNAARNPGEHPQYGALAPAAFAAFLRPEDVVSVTAGRYDPGQAIDLDIPALKEQLTPALYHQIADTYSQEKYGLCAIIIRVTGESGQYYPGDGEYDELSLMLSVGQAEDMVCLYRQNYGYDRNMTSYEFVYSPELYRTIRNLFD